MGRSHDEEALLQLPPLSQKEGRHSTGAFGPIALLLQVSLGIAFCFTSYDLYAHSVFESIELMELFKGVGVLALAGFGFLTSFLKAYGLGGISMSLFIVALGFQVSLLLTQAMSRGSVNDLKFDFVIFLEADFAVICALIGFGALLGKTSPTQVLFYTLCVCTACIANKVYFLHGFLDVMDVGGTISLHVFGAVFGLVASATMGAANNEVLAEGSRISETGAMLGSFFLGIYWPSFMSASLAEAHIAEGSQAQWCAITNTICAIAGSTTTAYGWGAMRGPDRRTKDGCRGGRMRTHVLASARLAGGVAIGCTAHIPMGPGPALLIGNAAGILSTWAFLSQLVPQRYDTSGITALNLLPGLLGAVASTLVPMVVPGTGVLPDNQIFGLLGSIIFAAAGGAITGLLLKCLGPPRVAYNDEAYLDVAITEEEIEMQRREEEAGLFGCAAARDDSSRSRLCDESSRRERETKTEYGFGH